MAFPYRNGLAVLANFSGPAKGFYLLLLPLRWGTTLELVPASSPEFAKVAATFESVAQDQTTKHQFCESRSKDFIAFYENMVDLASKRVAPLMRSIETSQTSG